MNSTIYVGTVGNILFVLAGLTVVVFCCYAMGKIHAVESTYGRATSIKAKKALLVGAVSGAMTMGMFMFMPAIRPDGGIPFTIIVASHIRFIVMSLATIYGASAFIEIFGRPRLSRNRQERANRRQLMDDTQDLMNNDRTRQLELHRERLS